MKTLALRLCSLACGLWLGACTHHGDAGDVDASAPPAHDASAPPPDGGAPPPDAGAPSEDGGAPVPSPDWLAEFGSMQDFASLAKDGSAVKFLLATSPEDLPEPLAERCLLQNTKRFPYHLQFLQSFPELSELSNPTYESWALFRSTRRFYAGVLELLPSAVHPGTAKLGVLAYTLYTAQTREELLTSAELIELNANLRACMGPLAELLVYVPASSAELAVARAEAEALEQGGVTFAGANDLRPDGQVEVYSAGEGYGFLRRVTAERALDEAGPRDVVVTDTAPVDLGLVAALITRSSQSSVSHLNLRLEEKGIPNARAPKLFGSALLAELQGELVHVTTHGGTLVIEPAEAADAEAFWSAQRGDPKRPPADTERSEIAALAELRHEDALGYGVKAANLGELTRALPSENRMVGLAIPFSAYLEHLEQNALGPAVTATIAQAARGGSAARQALDELRDAIRDAPVPEAWEQRFFDAVREQWGDAGLHTRLRFRSSTNVEDLPGLSGAGLYDSSSGCIADDLDDDETGPSHCLSAEQRAIYEAELARRVTEYTSHPEREHLPDLIEDLEEELSEEKSARRALRKVWASLWSERAFEDRQYHGIVHEAAFMGVAVHPAMVGEQLEAVAITELDSGGSAPLYRVASQLGEVGVARPVDPTAVAELLSFERGAEDAVTGVMLLQASSLVPPGETLWPEPRLAELARLLFDVHDHFANQVYPDLPPLSLDVEVDVSVDGQIVVKQARPYVGPHGANAP